MENALIRLMGIFIRIYVVVLQLEKLGVTNVNRVQGQVQTHSKNYVLKDLDIWIRRILMNVQNFPECARMVDARILLAAILVNVIKDMIMTTIGLNV